MAGNLTDIYNMLTRIRDDLHEVARRSQIAPTQIVVGEGLSDISERLGLVMAGEFRAGNSKEPGFGFSGVRIGYPPFSYGGENWHIVGIENDALQFGLRASDGVAVAGGGVVTLSNVGVTIVATTVFQNARAYKFSDGTDIFGGMFASEAAGGSANRVQVEATGGTTQSEVSLYAEMDGGSGVQITLREQANSWIIVNANKVDADTFLYGSVSGYSIITVDAAQELVGIGGTATEVGGTSGAVEAGYKLKITGDVKVTGKVETGTLGGKQWLSFGGAYAPLAAEGYPYTATVDRTVTFVKWTLGLAVITTNDGSNYWKIRLERVSDNSVIKEVNTSALSADTFAQLTATTFDIASVGTAGVGLYIHCVKQGSPGNLYIIGPALEVSA